jgi:membrane-bound ClpP family serine protease
LVGLLLTFAGRDLGPGWLPTSHDAIQRLKKGLEVVVGAMIVSVVIAVALRPFLPKLPLFRKLILTETSGGVPSAAGAPLKAGEDVWPFIGTVGIAVTDLKSGGIVEFPYGADTRNVSAVAVTGFVPAGSKVIVQEARGNRILVKKS